MQLSMVPGGRRQLLETGELILCYDVGVAGMECATFLEIRDVTDDRKEKKKRSWDMNFELNYSYQDSPRHATSMIPRFRPGSDKTEMGADSEQRISGIISPC